MPLPTKEDIQATVKKAYADIHKKLNQVNKEGGFYELRKTLTATFFRLEKIAVMLDLPRLTLDKVKRTTAPDRTGQPNNDVFDPSVPIGQPAKQVIDNPPAREVVTKTKSKAKVRKKKAVPVADLQKQVIADNREEDPKDDIKDHKKNQ